MASSRSTHALLIEFFEMSATTAIAPSSASPSLPVSESPASNNIRSIANDTPALWNADTTRSATALSAREYEMKTCP